MRSGNSLRARLLASAFSAGLLSAAVGAEAAEREFNIAPQALDTALADFSRQSMVPVLATPSITGSKQTTGVTGAADPQTALTMLLQGTGLTYRREGDTFLIVKADQGPQSGSAAGDGAEVEALIVTAQKREEDIQDVPIAISAFTQEQLTDRQVAGGPDLMTQVPNFTFTKTNFASYSIQIRGIGTQAISATTDAAVAVAFNNTPFIRNRFFEQEFYDLQRVEVLRGPQGTLYGRNATAGVVNIISAKPSFNYEARLSGDVSNYSSTRLEGMINLPLVEDKVALRLAGAWTKREGFVANEITGNPIDGRDLWSTRLSLRIAPTDRLEANLIWEHFEEDDDRLRSGKQLCHRDARTEITGHPVPPGNNGYYALFSQGCIPASMYSPEAFEAPNGFALPYYHPLGQVFLPVVPGFDPYVSTTQSRDLRVIESTVDPHYAAETDLAELQISFDLTDNLTLTSETGYLVDDLFSTQDLNRFNTASGAFENTPNAPGDRPGVLEPGPNGGIFCDPQIGCADRLVAVDLSTAQSTHFSEELRLSSAFDGPFNFSLGANYLRYDTEDKYYVFINTLTMWAAINPYTGFALFGSEPDMPAWQAGVSDNRECLINGFREPDPFVFNTFIGCVYVDPNPISSLNDMGHNYFLSRNPYKLISYAVFGEAYYNLAENLKITAGLRWTVDKKEAPRRPSWVLGANTVGYPAMEVIEQEWREPTGRLTIDWKPDLGFTDETLLYASYARGYKAGGANPPPAGIVSYSDEEVHDEFVENSVTQPKTFDAEFIDAYEVGVKNTLMDGQLTVNMAAFYYDYKGYQISQIVNRSAVNLNFDAKIWGLEIEADWRPFENLRLGFKGGYENTQVADGSQAIDLMDRTGGREDWVVVKPFPTFPSNCVLPLYVAQQTGADDSPLGFDGNLFNNGNIGPCEFAYVLDLDPRTGLEYVPDPTVARNGFDSLYAGYPGFDPTVDYGNHNGEGFLKDLSGNELPNAPHFTATITADYTVPLPNDWLATLHTDLYYQSEAWTRIFNTEGYDKLKAYTNMNLAAIFTNEEAGWKVMAYVKNVFDRDSITGAFLFSDDTGLTTNVFLTEPRLYGLRVTKDWNGGPWWAGANPNHAGPYPLTVELSGQVQQHDAPYEPLGPSFLGVFPDVLNTFAHAQNRDLDWGDGRELRLTYHPSETPWSISAALRYGRTNTDTARIHAETPTDPACAFGGKYAVLCDPTFYDGAYYNPLYLMNAYSWSDSSARSREEHLLVDFEVGRDVGLGVPGGGRSTLAAGIRYAEFESDTHAELNGIPHRNLEDGWIRLSLDGAVKYPSNETRYEAVLDAKREFEGAGPVLSWEASKQLFGDETLGRLGMDWSIAAGVMFGKQKTEITGFEEIGYWSGGYQTNPRIPDPEDIETTPVAVSRSDSVTVPLVDLSLGLSYEIQRVKIGAGYRWERYFDVLDVGYDEEQAADRTIDGPYFKVSVGFGG